jgi:hypothetical protein
VSGEKYPTLSDVMVCYNWLMDELEKLKCGKKLYDGSVVDSEIVKQAAAAALEKVKEYYDITNDIYYVATVLDPRLKLNFFSCDTRKESMNPDDVKAK